jgi:hypothetical protein
MINESFAYEEKTKNNHLSIGGKRSSAAPTAPI